MSRERVWRSGDVASEVGSSARTIRTWSDAGKLPEHLQPATNSQGQRYWNAEQVAQLREFWPDRHRLTRAPKPPTAREVAVRLRTAVRAQEDRLRERDGSVPPKTAAYLDAAWDLASRLTALGDAREADGLEQARALVESMELEQRAA